MENFDNLMDYRFTANMKKSWIRWLTAKPNGMQF